jgi:hypothetical protein
MMMNTEDTDGSEAGLQRAGIRSVFKTTNHICVDWIPQCQCNVYYYNLKIKKS